MNKNEELNSLMDASYWYDEAGDDIIALLDDIQYVGSLYGNKEVYDEEL